MMAEIRLPLCVHGEVSRPEVDIFDREAAFIDEVLNALSDEDRTSLLKSVCKSITIDGSNQVTITTFLPLDESTELDLPSAA